MMNMQAVAQRTCTVLEWLLQFIKFELISTLQLSRGLPLMHPGTTVWIWRGCR